MYSVIAEALFSLLFLWSFGFLFLLQFFNTQQYLLGMILNYYHIKFLIIVCKIYWDIAIFVFAKGSFSRSTQFERGWLSNVIFC